MKNSRPKFTYYSRFINTLWRTNLSKKVLAQIEKELRRTKFGTRVEASKYCTDVTPPTVEKIPVEEEPEVPIIPVIPDQPVPLEKVYYHGVLGLINYNKQGRVCKKEEHLEVDPDPYEQKIKDVILQFKNELHLRMIFDDNDREVDDHKEILHAKRWDT